MVHSTYYMFVAPAACLIETDCCGRECRESAWAEPSRSRMGLDAGWLLRRIGCGWIANSVHSMLAGRCWDAREWTFCPRTLRSTEGLDRRALATVTFRSSPSVIADVRHINTMYETSILIHPSTPVTRDELLNSISQFYGKSKGVAPQIAARGTSGIRIQFPGFGFSIVKDGASHVIEEAKEISTRYGTATGKQHRISDCNTRFDVQGDDDPDMEYFNDYLYIIEAAQKLGEAYAFDNASATFI
jgi:hypothetical protein